MSLRRICFLFNVWCLKQATTSGKSTWDTVRYFGINGLSMILCLWSRLHPLSKLLAIEDHTQNLEEQLWMGGRREVSTISHTPVNSRLAHKSSFWARSRAFERVARLWARSASEREARASESSVVRAGSYHTRPENQANDFEKVYREQERFAARKVVFSWECLNIFATGCSSCAYSKFIHPCLRYPFLQHQISNYQQILCHVF